MNSANKLLGNILPVLWQSYLSQRFPDWQSFIHQGELRFRGWLSGLFSALGSLTILAGSVCVAHIFGLYLLRGSWHLFENTMLGSQYIENVNAVTAADVSWVLSLDFKVLALTIILLTVLVSLAVGIISQLTMLRRFFYVGRSALVKLGWLVLVAGAVAHKFAASWPMDFYLSFGLCFLPTMVIFTSVLASAGKLVPELNLRLFMANLRERREVQALKDDVALLMKRGPSDDFD